MERSFDVVVCGGGLAGLTLARQLVRELGSSVAVVERIARPLPDAAHKVGESTVELASHYLGSMLGLSDYLRERHLIKNGLRFFPGGGRTHRLEERTEIGPPQLPKVPSYQLDRGRFESDLRAMCEADGVALYEGFAVRQLELGEPHRARVSRLNGEDECLLQSRWLIDASGRAGIIRKKLDLTEDNRHLANASWFRVEGRLSVEDLVSSDSIAWHKRDIDEIRWLSTNHLMGVGYWVWLIPLSSGHTSVGIVAHDSEHHYDAICSLERSLAWLGHHEPQLRRALCDRHILDFGAIRHYSHGTSRVFSSERWACIGEAGPFADPLYSPGSDFIAMANCLTTELIAMDKRGESIAERTEEYDSFYRRFFDVACETYRHAAPCYGSPTVMAAKVYWDDFNYWSFACGYFFKKIWRTSPSEHARFVALAQRFATLTIRAQTLLSEWAKRLEGDEPSGAHIILPPIPSRLATLHSELDLPMSVEETYERMTENASSCATLLEELILRALLSLPKERGLELIETTKLTDWGITISRDRCAIEELRGGARRRALSPLARDLERCLGRPAIHPRSALFDRAFPATESRDGATESR